LCWIPAHRVPHLIIKLLLAANEDLPITSTERLSMGLGASDIASATAIIHNLWIGSLLIPEIEVAVLDLSTINIAYSQMGHPEVLGVIGSDILMAHRAVIDFGKKVLVLK
jgi:hypothetical protein